MADDSKLWLALFTAGLALAGTVFTAIMSVLGHRELAHLNARLQAERDDRLARVEVEKVIARFRDPLMLAAYDLQSRIYNILQQDFLGRYYVNGTEIEKEYAIENTVFLLAQFLAWTELLRQEVQFLDLGSDDRTRKLRDLQDQIYSQLQTDTIPSGFRLFAGEQRAIGELMVDRTGTTARCLGFAAFLENRHRRLDAWLGPLRNDIRRMSIDLGSYRDRLIPIQHSLIAMLEFFDPQFVRFPAKTRTTIPHPRGVGGGTYS